MSVLLRERAGEEKIARRALTKERGFVTLSEPVYQHAWGTRFTEEQGTEIGS
jgi:hypothetical protein